jgi:hypothetical protein
MTTFEYIQVITGVVQVVATLLIALVVAIQAQRLKRGEMSGQALEAYNVLNSVALESPENLQRFDSFGRTQSGDTDETRRKRWCAFIWLVALQQTFISWKDGLIEKRYADQALKQQLRIILLDDLVFWLVLNRGFHPDFAAYCTGIRREVAPTKSVHYSEEVAIRGTG